MTEVVINLILQTTLDKIFGQSKEIKENTIRLYQDKTKTAISAFAQALVKIAENFISGVGKE